MVQRIKGSVANAPEFGELRGVLSGTSVNSLSLAAI